MESHSLTTILIALLAAVLAVSLLVGRSAKLSARELLLQTMAMSAAAL